VRGIVYDGTAPAVRTDVEVRPPGPTDVAIRIVNAGVCHSDLSVLDGSIPFPTPLVMGHEGAGVVDAVGSEVTKLKVGDHVVLSTLKYCGQCSACNTGFPTRCRRSFGVMSQPFTVGGEPAYNFAATSVFTDVTVVDQVQAVKVSKDIPLQSACLIGCGVITGAGAVLNTADVTHGQTVAVFGVGGIGLNVIQAAKLCDASRIIAVDTMASKKDLALDFGATDFVDASDGGAVEQIQQLVKGGVDWSFECVGHPAVVGDAVKALDWGGNCVIIGVPAPTAKMEVPITHLTHIDRGVRGCRYGGARPHHDIPLLVQLYLDGKLKLDELVSKTYPMESFAEVVEDMHAGRLARGVLTYS